MQPLFPKRVGIDSQMIANLRIKCRALLSSRDSPPNEVYEIPRIQADYLLSDAITPLPSLVAEVLDETRLPSSTKQVILHTKSCSMSSRSQIVSQRIYAFC